MRPRWMLFPEYEGNSQNVEKQAFLMCHNDCTAVNAARNLQLLHSNDIAGRGLAIQAVMSTVSGKNTAQQRLVQMS